MKKKKNDEEKEEISISKNPKTHAYVPAIAAWQHATAGGMGRQKNTCANRPNARITGLGVVPPGRVDSLGAFQHNTQGTRRTALHMQHHTLLVELTSMTRQEMLTSTMLSP